MNTWKLIIILMCYESFTLGNDLLCFKFTWPGAMPEQQSSKLNCTGGSYLGVPCITPILNEWSYPNTDEIYQEWLNSNETEPEKNQNSTVCRLHKGLSCIKYTNIYNNAILFASHYCGRIIEDKTIPISSGCFNYQTNGRTIEVCACQSEPGRKPCNTATKQSASILILFSSVIILFYHFHGT